MPKIRRTKKKSKPSTPMNKTLPLRTIMKDPVTMNVDDTCSSDDDDDEITFCGQVDVAKDTARKQPPVAVVLIKKLASASTRSVPSSSSTYSPSSSQSTTTTEQCMPGSSSSTVIGATKTGVEDRENKPSFKSELQWEDVEQKPGCGSMGLDSKALESWVKNAKQYVIELERSKVELKRRWDVEKSLRQLQESHVLGLEARVKELKLELTEKDVEVARINSKLLAIHKLINNLQRQAEELE